MKEENKKIYKEPIKTENWQLGWEYVINNNC